MWGVARTPLGALALGMGMGIVVGGGEQVRRVQIVRWGFARGMGMRTDCSRLEGGATRRNMKHVLVDGSSRQY